MFLALCSMLNEYHNDPDYIIAYMIRSCIVVVKYGDKVPRSADENQALISAIRSEYKKVMLHV